MLPVCLSRAQNTYRLQLVVRALLLSTDNCVPFAVSSVNMCCLHRRSLQQVSVLIPSGRIWTFHHGPWRKAEWQLIQLRSAAAIITNGRCFTSARWRSVFLKYISSSSPCVEKTKVKDTLWMQLMGCTPCLLQREVEALVLRPLTKTFNTSVFKIKVEEESRRCFWSKISAGMSSACDLSVTLWHHHDPAVTPLWHFNDPVGASLGHHHKMKII